MKIVDSKYEILTDHGVISTAAREVANIRGVYGKDTEVTLYINDPTTFRRLMDVEGHAVVPFPCEIVVDPERVLDPCGVALEYRRKADHKGN